eukprot:1375861-Amorphochlora_amoeboformis.AAC.1
MEDASSWALAKGMASGTPAQPATQGNATNARERRVKPVERQMRDIYRKVRPCFNALCTLSEDGRRLASSGERFYFLLPLCKVICMRRGEREVGKERVWEGRGGEWEYC